MGLTERHWFENKEPELTDRQLEDIVYENKKAYDNGYVKGIYDAKILGKYLIEFGVKIGFLSPEKAEQLLKELPQIVRCKDCKYGKHIVNTVNGKVTIYRVFCVKPYVDPRNATHEPDWFCADGKPKSD